MNYMKRMLGVALAMCMILALAACGGGAGSGAEVSNDNPATSGAVSTPADSSTPATSEEETPVDDGKVTYTVSVIDEDGNPVSGIMVQICKDVCMPAITDADGIATWSLAEDEYKVSFPTSPAGFIDYTGSEFYFDAGSTEMTIILTPAE